MSEVECNPLTGSVLIHHSGLIDTLMRAALDPLDELLELELAAPPVARRLREDPTGRRLRVVALTGYGLPEDRERALAAGFDAHVVKPVDLEKLRTILADA